MLCEKVFDDGFNILDDEENVQLMPDKNKMRRSHQSSSTEKVDSSVKNASSLTSKQACSRVGTTATSLKLYFSIQVYWFDTAKFGTISRVI